MNASLQHCCEWLRHRCSHSLPPFLLPRHSADPRGYLSFLCSLVHIQLQEERNEEFQHSSFQNCLPVLLSPSAQISNSQCSSMTRAASRGGSVCREMLCWIDIRNKLNQVKQRETDVPLLLR